MTIADMLAFLIANVPGFDPASTDLQISDAYADYQGGGPAPEPLSLDEVKKNLRVDTTDDDDLITGLIVAAREHVEGATELVLTPRTVIETRPELGRWIDLASWPVTSITAIRHPLAGVMTPLATGAYAASRNRRPVRVIPTALWWGLSRWAGCLPTLPIEIEVQAGYATPADVPAAVKQAMHMLISHWYTNRPAAEVGARAAAIEVPFGVDALLQRWKVWRI